MQTAEAKRIREFHTLGKRILKVYGASQPLADGNRRRGVAQAFNRTLGLQRDQVDKARQFAAMYSDEEVEALCELKSASDGKRITKSHVIRLLAIGNRRERHKLAKQVVREQWSVQRLGAEITRQGKSSEGGRWPKRPSTVGEAMGQIQRMAQQWKRWVEMMSDQDDASGVGIGHLPKAAARAVAKMRAAARSAATEVELLVRIEADA
jgi:hypothetical protein